MKTIKYLAFLLMAASCTLPVAAAPMLEWVEQFGEQIEDIGWGISPDSQGNVYVTGEIMTQAADAAYWSEQAFLSKHDSLGNLLWKEVYGTGAISYSFDLAVGQDGIYTVGSTLNGSTRSASLNKFDTNGNLLWTEQIGTTNSSRGYGVSADDLGNVYITGTTSEILPGTNSGEPGAFISKYDTNGTLLWAHQWEGNSNDIGRSISTDSLGNVYVSGETNKRPRFDNNSFLRKFDAEGTLLWAKTFDTSTSTTSTVSSLDGLGNVYVTNNSEYCPGGTAGCTGSSKLRKFDTDGTLLWNIPLNLGISGYSKDVIADSLGNTYITGNVLEDFGSKIKPLDVFLRKYDPSGNLLWTEVLGSSGHDLGYAISINEARDIFVTGWTDGVLGETSEGSRDVFLAKYSDPIPEPTTLLLATLASSALIIRRRQ